MEGNRVWWPGMGLGVDMSWVKVTTVGIFPDALLDTKGAILLGLLCVIVQLKDFPYKIPKDENSQYDLPNELNYVLRHFKGVDRDGLDTAKTCWGVSGCMLWHDGGNGARCKDTGETPLLSSQSLNGAHGVVYLSTIACSTHCAHLIIGCLFRSYLFFQLPLGSHLQQSMS